MGAHLFNRGPERFGVEQRGHRSKGRHRGNRTTVKEDEDTCKTSFEGAGYQVECVLKGLGEYEAIRQMLVDRLKGAIAK